LVPPEGADSGATLAPVSRWASNNFLRAFVKSPRPFQSAYQERRWRHRANHMRPHSPAQQAVKTPSVTRSFVADQLVGRGAPSDGAIPACIVSTLMRQKNQSAQLSHQFKRRRINHRCAFSRTQRQHRRGPVNVQVRQRCVRIPYPWFGRQLELSLVMLKIEERSLQVEMLGSLCGLGNPMTCSQLCLSLQEGFAKQRKLFVGLQSAEAFRCLLHRGRGPAHCH